MILSNKSGFCHGIRPGKRHTRLLLSGADPLRVGFRRLRRPGGPVAGGRMALRPAADRVLRRWDYQAAQTSRHTSSPYRGDVQAPHPAVLPPRFHHHLPPVDAGPPWPSRVRSHDAYYLIVSRLVPYRRIDLAIEAFNTLGLPLLIAGDGRDRARLEALAGPNVQIPGPRAG